MSHKFRVFDRGRLRPSILAVAAIVVGAFSLGLLTATRTRAWSSQQTLQSGNHEVSQKLWVSAQ
jgi:hypothetical protein